MLPSFSVFLEGGDLLSEDVQGRLAEAGSGIDSEGFDDAVSDVNTSFNSPYSIAAGRPIRRLWTRRLRDSWRCCRSSQWRR